MHRLTHDFIEKQKNKRIMKKLFLLLTLAAPFWLSAQQSLNRFFDKYAGSEGFTSVNVSADLYDMFASMDFEGDEDLALVKEAILDFRGLQVLTYEDAGENGQALKYFDEALALLPRDDYTEMLSVTSPDDNVRILARSPQEGIVDNVLILVGNDDEFVLVKVDGSFDLSRLGDLAKDFDLEKIHEKREEMQKQGK